MSKQPEQRSGESEKSEAEQLDFDTASEVLDWSEYILAALEEVIENRQMPEKQSLMLMHDVFKALEDVTAFFAAESKRLHALSERGTLTVSDVGAVQDLLEYMPRILSYKERFEKVRKTFVAQAGAMTVQNNAEVVDAIHHADTTPTGLVRRALYNILNVPSESQKAAAMGANFTKVTLNLQDFKTWRTAQLTRRY